ncbi:hypothetical protein ACFWBF_18025 [Streptomyces sp. NPDC060028]|uniref:hypothetical protein n=1 Tax=Streptomyces sp. NPDC060028 TaxID=3347041 RepID=UPI00368FD49C
MDPASVVVAGGTVGMGCLVRIAYCAIKERSDVRRAEVAQQGLSERVRSLPPGSRLTERTADREVEIVVGVPAGGAGER